MANPLKLWQPRNVSGRVGQRPITERKTPRSLNPRAENRCFIFSCCCWQC